MFLSPSKAHLVLRFFFPKKLFISKSLLQFQLSLFFLAHKQVRVTIGVNKNLHSIHIGLRLIKIFIYVSKNSLVSSFKIFFKDIYFLFRIHIGHPTTFVLQLSITSLLQSWWKDKMLKNLNWEGWLMPLTSICSKKVSGLIKDNVCI